MSLLLEECHDQFIEAVVTMAEEMKRDTLKKEKGSLDKNYKDNVALTAQIFLRLTKELLDKEGVTAMAHYLYFRFEKPIGEYLGFTMPEISPYK